MQSHSVTQALIAREKEDNSFKKIGGTATIFALVQLNKGFFCQFRFSQCKKIEGCSLDKKIYDRAV